MTGVASDEARATHEPSPNGLGHSVGVANAVPSLAERNEGFVPPTFDAAGGKLGETPILWQFRMAYEWRDHFAEEYPDWDQCCTCWVFAISEGEARAKVWSKFKHAGAVVPIAIASCHPERFRNAKDDAIDARLAQGTPTRSAETTGSVGEADGGPVAESDAPETPLSTPLPSGSIER